MSQIAPDADSIDPNKLNPIMDLGDDGCIGYYLKGHWDKGSFVRSVGMLLAVEGIDQAYYAPWAKPLDWINSNAARHEWWRSVPIRGNIVADAQFVKANGPGPGAFPVTVVGYDAPPPHVLGLPTDALRRLAEVIHRELSLRDKCKCNGTTVRVVARPEPSVRGDGGRAGRGVCDCGVVWTTDAMTGDWVIDEHQD